MFHENVFAWIGKYLVFKGELEWAGWITRSYNR